MDCKRMFLVRLNNDKTIAIPFVLNMSFIFSCKYLTRWQQCYDACYKYGSVYFNVISYGNKRLFDHIK